MLFCWSVYTINRFLIKPIAPHYWHWIHNWFQDFLLVPSLLPLILWGLRKLDLRTHDRVPTWPEILLHTSWWSFFFEFFGPRVLHKGTADIGDVIAYFTGGILSGLIWHLSYKNKTSRDAAKTQR